MRTIGGVIILYKATCLDYLEYLKFKDNGYNEADVIYDMRGILHLLDILDDRSLSADEKMIQFQKEERKIYWNFGFRY